MKSKLRQIKFFYSKSIQLLLLCLLLMSFSATAQFYNGSQLTFGKNRVQYTDNFWTFYRYDKFDTYFYLNGKSLAIYTAKYADLCISSIEKELDYNLENKIQFIIFNRLSDLKASNIGLVSDEQYNVGGITHIIGSKVFIYYDGSHENLKRQIKAGIARVVLNELMFGEQITAKIKNSTLLSLPDWYVQGLVSYLAENWYVELDNYVKDGILSGSYEKFNQLAGSDAVYAGHSIWKYIADKYGEDKIHNILYMTKISKSVESGFLYVLGVSFKTFTQEWIDYYDKKYYGYDKELSFPTGEKLLKKRNQKRVVQQVKISPDGSSMAFITNELGQYKVWLYNFEKKKLKRLMKSGNKLDEKTDYSTPILAWHPTGKRLSIITEIKGKIWLYYYNLDEDNFEKQRLFDFQKILDFSYAQNGKLLVMSGVQRGQTDIYVYNLGSHTYEQITKDIYDDLNPVFINNSKQIIFSSNRTNDTLKFNSKDSITITDSKLDIYLYDYANKGRILRRLTNTPLTDETNPLVLNNNYISYLSDQNGIVNRFTASLDSSISFVDTTTHYRFYTTSYPQTNYPRNIMNYDVCPKVGKCGEVIYNKGLYQIYMGTLPAVDSLAALELKNSPYMVDYLKDQTAKQNKLNAVAKDQKTGTSDSVKTRHKHLSTIHAGDTVRQKNAIDIDNYTFSTGVKTATKKQSNKDTLTAKTDTAKEKSLLRREFVLPKQRNYDVEYSIDQLVNQVDFSYLNNTYQPFTNVGAPIFINPGFNALFKVGVTDLLEDYRITGGVRLSVDMDNTEYVLSFENLLHRLDKQTLFHRQVQRVVVDNGSTVVKHTSNEVLYVLKWPFSQVLAIKGTGQIRNDRAVYLATDQLNLQRKNEYKTWAGLKGELVFDNTRDKGLNIYYGTRYKLFAEIYRQLDAKNKQLNVIGFDFRNYKKISRTFIWANRFAASTSFGTQKLVYYMGGVDNWLFPKFDSSITVAQNQNYAYQTLATNMRGFKQNIRNGNSFVLFNSELRLPVFRYFINRPLKSDFFNTFQIAAFADIGTAWTGSNPYSDKNALYQSIISQGPITVTITTQKQPIVGGFGAGLRARLLGYFLRADWAYGVEDGVVLPRVFYLSDQGSNPD